MGNTPSTLLILIRSSAYCKPMYYIALSVSAYITLVCLLDIPRSHVFLQVHQVVQAVAVPTITADGSPVASMGTTGSFGDLVYAKLDSSQTVVLIADSSNGLLLASAAPYAFDKRTTANGTTVCSFDSMAVSAPATSNIYCRVYLSSLSDTFLAFKYSDLSTVQDSGNNPLFAGSGTNLGSKGMLTVVGSFMFVTSYDTDSLLYRVDLSTLTYTGNVTSTKSVQDTSATTQQYRSGICDSNGFCYAFSTSKRLAKFTQDTSGSPTYVTTLDLSQSGQLDSGGFHHVCFYCLDVVLDRVGNNLLVATTAGTCSIAKIDLGTFAYVSKVTLTDVQILILCENCVTASSGETYMMVISHNSEKDARFIKLSDMTEVTDAGTFVNTASFAQTGWLTTTPGNGYGGIVNHNAEVQKLTTGVLGISISPTTTTPKTGTRTRTTTNDDSPPSKKKSKSHSNTEEIKEPPLSSAAIVVVSDEVSAALVTSDVAQSFSMGALAIGSAATPALGFSVARQQQMMNYAQNALKGDCRGLLPATKTSGEEDSENENPLGAADSPTRMQIGDSVSRAYIGACVGNFILFCGLIILNQGIGHLVTKIIIAKYFSIPSNMKLAIMFSKKKKKEFEQQQNRWKDFKYVFANSFVSLSLFYLVALFLSPTLTSAVVVVAGVSNDIVPVGMKILCLILAFIIAGVGVYFIIWSTFIRNPRREKYRIINQEEENARNNKKELGAGDLFKSLCKPDGEWKIPINKRTEKENDEFQISNPCYESYRKNHWFAVVEIITSILICLPPLFAQLGSSGKSSCIIQGSLLFFILLVYTILLIWKNPKKLKIMRILAPAMAVQQLITVGMSLIAVVTRKDDDSHQNSAKEESWLWKAIFVPLGFSVFVGFFAAAAAVFPLLLFVKKVRVRIQKQQQEREALMKKQNFSSGGGRSSRNNRRNDDDDREMRELTGSSRRRGEEHTMRRSSRHHDDERRSRGIQDHRGSSEFRSSRDHNNRHDREDTHHRSFNDYRDRDHGRDSKEREDRRVSSTARDSSRRYRESFDDYHRHHDHRSFKSNTYDYRRSNNRDTYDSNEHRRRDQSDDKRSPRSREKHHYERHRDENNTIHHHGSSRRHSPRGERKDDDHHRYHQHREHHNFEP